MQRGTKKSHEFVIRNVGQRAADADGGHDLVQVHARRGDRRADPTRRIDAGEARVDGQVGQRAVPPNGHDPSPTIRHSPTVELTIDGQIVERDRR